MPTLKQLNLKNIVLFKEASLKLDRKGITVIRGLNKDADRRQSEDSTNAAGKSLLVSAISNIIRGSDPVVADIKGIRSKAKGDFFTEKDSSMELVVSSGGSEFNIKKTAKAYQLLENGDDTNSRGKKYIEEKIQSIFNYSDDEFYTLYHISSSRPNNLQYGSPTQRLEFFTNLFRLNSYDAFRKRFSSMLTKMKREVAVLDEVRSELKKAKHEYSTGDIPGLKKELEELTAKQESDNENLHKAYSDKHTLQIVRDNIDTYFELIGLSDSLHVSIPSSVKSLSKISRDLERTKLAYDEYTEEYYKYKLNSNLLKKRASEDAAYQAKLKKYEKYSEFDHEYFKSLELSVAKLTQANEVIEKLPANLPKLEDEAAIKKAFEKYTGHEYRADAEYIQSIKDEFDDYVQKALTDVATSKKQLRLFDKLRECKTCPTCQQSLSSKESDEIRSSLLASVEKYDTRLLKVEKLVDAIDDAGRFVRDSARHVYVKKARANQEKIKAALKEGTEELESLQSSFTKFKSYEKYAKAYKVFLSSASDPVTVDKPRPPCSQEEYSSIISWIDAYQKLLPVYDTIHKYAENYISVDSVNSDLRKLDRKIKKLSDSNSERNGRIPELASKIAILQSVRLNIKKLRSRRDELLQAERDIPVLETLIGAYSNKGIKMMVIKQLASIIEANMNKFAPLLYKERVKFKFEVGENTFNIYKESVHDGKKRVVDVRRLSGAQSRCFSFLLPLSILPLVPAKNRLNIMILDEPTTNLDFSTRTLFMENFIPKLSSVIPHLIIVTPLDDSYKNQKVYTVVKEHGWSELVAT